MIRGFLFSISKKSSDFDVYRFTRDLVDGRKDPKRKKGIGCIENKWILVLDLRFQLTTVPTQFTGEMAEWSKATVC